MVIMTVVTAGVLAILAGFVLSYYLGGLGTALARDLLITSTVLGVCFFGLASFLSFNGSITKLRQALLLARSLPLGGDELILDVGCGRGAFSVAVAKEANSGLVIGVDEWNPWHVTGNNPKSLMANAEVTGVAGKVHAVKGRGSGLPFPDSKFDVVGSCLGLSHLGNGSELEATLSEMVRVLREGGSLAILSAGYGRRFPKRLSTLGLKDIRISRFRMGVIPLAERITARKPYSSVAPALRPGSS